MKIPHRMLCMILLFVFIYLFLNGCCVGFLESEPLIQRDPRFCGRTGLKILHRPLVERPAGEYFPTHYIQILHIKIYGKIAQKSSMGLWQKGPPLNFFIQTGLAFF